MLLLVVGPSLRADPAGAVLHSFHGTGTGAIPDKAVSGCAPPAGPPLVVEFEVDQGGGVEAIGLQMDMNHTYLGDLEVTLVSPQGTEHIVFAATGSQVPTGYCGFSADLDGTYVFGDAETGDWWAAANGAAGGTLETGGYRTSTPGDVDTGGALTEMNATFANEGALGTWLLRFEDEGFTDTGTVNGAILTLATTLIFGDGFESGDFFEWSSPAP